MLSLHFKRLLTLFPLLIVLSILCFFMRSVVPQDPVEQSLGIYLQNEEDTRGYSNEEYTKEARKLNLDLPPFYFSIKPNIFPDEIYTLVLRRERKFAESMLKAGKDWEDIMAYLQFQRIPDQFVSLNNIAKKLISQENIQDQLNGISEPVKEIALKLSENTPKATIFPTFKLNGFNNQYHQWIKSFFVPGRLLSSIDKKPVTPKILAGLAWTFTFSFFSLIIIFALGITLGIWQVASQSKLSRGIQFILDLIYSMPLFWFATLMVVFFTTSDYGKWTNIFPAVHSFNFKSTGLWNRIFSNIELLILPILCISLHSLSYVSSLTASNLKDQLSKPFITTARQKGLSKIEIIKRHGIKNSIFPLITLFTSSLPRMFAGALIIEVIFNFHGMGRLIYNAVLLADWNLVFPCILMLATLTLLSYWFADLLYYYFDPKTQKQNKP